MEYVIAGVIIIVLSLAGMGPHQVGKWAEEEERQEQEAFDKRYDERKAQEVDLGNPKVDAK